LTHVVGVFNLIKQMPVALGKMLHEARRAKKKTLRGLAAEIGISAALLSLIEQGKHVPPKELIVRLAEHLGGDATQWCAIAGQVTPEAERKLAQIARQDPMFFRAMLHRRRGAR
jgi:transcriptional regulator with XRE-family HTH domain